MHWFLFLLLLVTSVVIFYQDLSSRSVWWYLFPFTAILGIINTYMLTGSWKQTLIYSLINTGITGLQFALLKLYFSLKKNGNSRLINEKIGLGDLLFLLAACCFFSPFNFLLFYCGSLLFTLIFHWLIGKMVNNVKFSLTVPLAGWMAVFLILYIITFHISKNVLTEDDWLLNHLL